MIFQPLSTAEQRARAKPVLQRAADLYRERFGSLFDCLCRAAESNMDRLYALRVLQGVLWELDVPGWEAARKRRRSEVWQVLKTAIRWCSRRRGGHSVTGRRPDRLPETDVPATRQWLEWLPRNRFA